MAFPRNTFLWKVITHTRHTLTHIYVLSHSHRQTHIYIICTCTRTHRCNYIYTETQRYIGCRYPGSHIQTQTHIEICPDRNTHTYTGIPGDTQIHIETHGYIYWQKQKCTWTQRHTGIGRVMQTHIEIHNQTAKSFRREAHSVCYKQPFCSSKMHTYFSGINYPYLSKNAYVMLFPRKF